MPPFRVVAYGSRVPILTNPAARLHTLLSALAATNESASLQACWGSVLGVEGPALWRSLAEVAALIPAVEQAVEATGDEQQLAAVRQFSEAWSNAIFAPSQTYGHARGSVPDPIGLTALGMISSYLALVSPEGSQPAPEQVAALSGQVQELIADVTVASDLPPEVRRLILQHLGKVDWALRHLRIGGPGAVREATEALVGAILLNAPRRTRETKTWQNVAAVMGLVWIAFTGPDQGPPALEAWQDLGRVAIEQAADHEVPPPIVEAEIVTGDEDLPPRAAK